MSTTQLTDINNFESNNIIFSKPDEGNIDKIKFKRIRIGVRNPNGTTGDLIIATPPHLHCFGLQESRDLGTNAINGYSMPLCLWNRNGATEDEKLFTDTFTQIADYCKKYLLDHKEDIEKYDLDASDLKKFNPLFWKMEKGKVVEGRGPMLYPKVILNKKTNRITTIFVNEDTNEETEPFEMLNKPCSVTAAIKIESIFIGNKISLQVKLFEVVYKMRDTTIRGLLRPNAQKMGDRTKLTDARNAEDDSFDTEDDGSIQLEDHVQDLPGLSSATDSLPVTNVAVVMEDDVNDEVDEDTEFDEPPPPAPPVVETKKKTTTRTTKSKK